MPSTAVSVPSPESIEMIGEQDLLAAIARADRYTARADLELPPMTSALAEIYGLMIYERAHQVAVSRLTAPQLAAWQASQQMELLGMSPSEKPAPAAATEQPVSIQSNQGSL